MSLPKQNPPRQHHADCIAQPIDTWDGGLCYWCGKAAAIATLREVRSVRGVPRANPTAYQVFISKLAYDSIVFHGKRQGKVTQVYSNQAVWIGEPWNGDCALIKESNVHEFEVKP